MTELQIWISIFGFLLDDTNQIERGPMTRQSINRLVAQINERAKFHFPVNPHMLQHSTGFFLANKDYDTRLTQDYMGHKNINHTVIHPHGDEPARGII